MCSAIRSWEESEVEVVLVLKAEDVAVDAEVEEFSSSAARRAMVSCWEARKVCMLGTETSMVGFWFFDEIVEERLGTVDS